MMPVILQAVIYTRVSKDVSAGRSVQDQETECRSLCERNGWEVRRVYCDNDIGASRHSVKDRPAWKRLKADLRGGDILVVWEASRAQRDLEEFVELRNLCAQLNVPLSYAGRVLDLTLGDDRFVGGLDALLAEREAEQIRTRVLRGKRASAAEGRPPGRPPWGYRRMGVAKWEPDPVEAPRIKEAVAKILSGETRYAVLQWLKSTGYAPASITALKRALGNPALAGLRVHQEITTGKGTWEPIITEQQHLLLGGRGRNHITPGPEPKYLLSGIAKCGVCGEGLQRKKRKTNRQPTYECHRGHCMRTVEHFDKLVVKELFKILAEIDPNEHESDDPIALAAIQETGEIEEKLEEWITAAEKGEVTPAAFSRIEKSLRARAEALKPKTVLGDRRRMDPDRLKMDWPILTMRERRDIIRLFLAITVYPVENRGGRTHGGAFLKPH